MKSTVAKVGACLLGAVVAAPLYAQQTPSYYPESYAKIVEASKSEPGVLVYSIMSAQNWKPVLESFHKKYPWIKVETLDLSNEIWSRYYSEKAAGARTADMVITLGVGQWIEFVNKGEAALYESPESKYVPQWSKPFPGVYSVSADPVMIVWNSKVLPGKKITSMAQVAELASDPKLQGKLTTYDGGSGAMTMTFPWVWSQYHKNDGWAILDKVGPASKPERSGGTMLSKVVTGEYALAYLTSAITVLPKLNDPGVKGVVEWSFITDGQPIYARAMSITKAAKSPNSAKLLLDHAISHEGQVGWGKGGLTPLRDDVRDDEVPFYTYKRIEKEVGGPGKIQVLGYDQKSSADADEYVKRWKAAYKRP
jgi:iron(III) transport system substrate-binding protein